MMEGCGFIYGIRLIGSLDVFYVGQTRQTIEARMRQHMRGRTPVSKALQMFGDLAFFDVDVLETVEFSRLNERERHWIAALRTRHPNGMNQMPGGDAHEHTMPSRLRMSAAMKAKCAEPAYRAQMAARNKANWTNPTYRAQQAAGLDKIRATDEYRDKIGASKKQLWKNAAHRERMSKSAKEQWLDPEQREAKTARIRQACAEPAHKAKQAANKKALWADPSWKAKQVAAVKEGLAKRRAALNAVGQL